MDIDFMKWMCEKAEGFESTDVFISHKHGDNYKYFNYNCEILLSEWKFVFYPFLKTKAIEGVNARKGRFHIVINAETVFVMIDDSLDTINHRYYDYSVPPNKSPIDHAKESALKYIYELENKTK